MSYLSQLKTLRNKMLESSTGQVQEVKSDSIIPMRVEQEAQPTSEDLVDRSARWLSQIRQASSEIRQKTTPEKSGGFAEGFQSSLKISKKAKEEAERKEAFIERRKDDSPSMYAPKRPNEGGGTSTPVPVDAEVKNVLDAIAAVESRGSGDYAAKGPVVKKGQYKGQRAYGRYQVMEGNIASWTKQALGKSHTVEEFMADPSIQDAVAADQLSRSKAKYGTWEDAASVWFSGRPVAKAGNASDGYTTVPEYITKFRRNFVG